MIGFQGKGQFQIEPPKKSSFNLELTDVDFLMHNVLWSPRETGRRGDLVRFFQV
jgi:hypothetical protein